MFSTKDNTEYAEMFNAYVNAGNAEVIEKLGGQVSAGGAGGFEVGDHIDWPDELKALKLKVRNNTTQAFLVQVTNKEGVNRYQLFYPSTLSKSVRDLTVDAEGKVLKENGFIRTKGTAAKAYQEAANLEIDTVMRKLIAEHPNGLNVTTVEQPWTYRFQTKEPVRTNLYTIDFAA